MSRRVLALALALLLLLTQQLGVQHRAAHGLSIGRDAGSHSAWTADALALSGTGLAGLGLASTGLTSTGLDDIGASTGDPAAPNPHAGEAACQVCLLLAALTLAALPAWLCWRGLALRHPAPAARAAVPARAAAGRPYQARAPPR